MTQPTNINPNEHIRIANGYQVGLHFQVGLENGTVLDSTFERENPIQLIIGDGNLLPGFEQVLLGLRVGDKRTANLSPEEAFGEWNPQNVQQFDINQFIAINEQNPEIGQMIEFADKGNNTLAGVVAEVSDTEVTVDFNHPLAGKTVLFTVEVFSVLPANASAVQIS